MARKRAFTLVELLVVMAIIAVLVSVLVPALNDAREQAQFLVCKTNLKGYGQGLYEYLQDSAGVFPPSGLWLWGSGRDSVTGTVTDPYYRMYPERATWAGGSDGERGTWRYPDHAPTGLMWSYLGQERAAHICPRFDRLTNLPTGYNSAMELSYSYVQNAYIGNDWDEHAKRGARFAFGGVTKETQVKRAPARVLTHTEESSAGWGLNDTTLLPWLELFRRLQDIIGGYHYAPDDDPFNGGVANAVFLDGHVGQVKHEGPMDSVYLLWVERDWQYATSRPTP